MIKRVITVIIFFFIFSHLLVAQNVEVSIESLRDSLKDLRRELDGLKINQELIMFRMDSVLSILDKEEEQKKEEGDLEELLKEASELAVKERAEEADVSKKFHSGVRQQQGLNPNISMGGDFFGAISSSKNDFISDPGDISYGNNGFFLREVELGLEAPLDPFTRGKTFISITKEEISIEEAYMEWLNLPLNMNLKIGIFYAEFGPLNRYHDHALPQFDRPRALVNLFSNKGLGGTGISSNFMLPEIFFADASTLDITVINGNNTGDGFSFDGNKMLYIGQFKNFYDISKNSYFEIRLSGVTGKNPSPGENFSYINSLGLNYKWVPIGREKYKTFDWKTELFYSYRDQNSGSVESKGFYSSVQNKLNARFWIGARIGYSELPYDNKQNEWDYSINLDFWQSEFVFTRIQYQYNNRNVESRVPYHAGSLPSDHSIVLQVCWAMGPHKHEAY